MVYWKPKYIVPIHSKCPVIIKKIPTKWKKVGRQLPALEHEKEIKYKQKQQQMYDPNTYLEEK